MEKIYLSCSINDFTIVNYVCTDVRDTNRTIRSKSNISSFMLSLKTGRTLAIIDRSY